MNAPLWSGPSRALQAHTQLFEQVDGEVKTLRKPGRYMAPRAFEQRLKLMTSMGYRGRAPSIQIQMDDGSTVVTSRDNESEMGNQVNIQRTQLMFGNEHKLLDEGETHYVSARVMEMVSSAAESMEPEPLFSTDVPAPSGLIVLEKPFLMPDLHPDTGEFVEELIMPIRMIGWLTADVFLPDSGEIRQGITYVLYTDKESFLDTYVPSYKKMLPDADTEWAENIPLDVWASDMSGWAFGAPWKQGEWETRPGPGAVVPTVALLRRWLLSYFRFTWQRILVHQEHRPNRAEQRQMVRAGRNLDEAKIKVVYLRRQYEAEQRRAKGEGDPNSWAKYDFAWMVGSHWRQQWYRSLGDHHHPDGSFNEESHRRIWIEDFIKGNPFAPLAVGHRVKAAVR